MVAHKQDGENKVRGQASLELLVLMGALTAVLLVFLPFSLEAQKISEEGMKAMGAELATNKIRGVMEEARVLGKGNRITETVCVDEAIEIEGLLLEKGCNEVETVNTGKKVDIKIKISG